MGRFANANGPLRYLIQNSTKSLCQPSDSTIRDLFEFADFALFWTNFSDNVVTVDPSVPTSLRQV
jgi:hypothetical protein